MLEHPIGSFLFEGHLNEHNRLSRGPHGDIILWMGARHPSCSTQTSEGRERNSLQTTREAKRSVQSGFPRLLAATSYGDAHKLGEGPEHVTVEMEDGRSQKPVPLAMERGALISNVHPCQRGGVYS